MDLLGILGDGTSNYNDGLSSSGRACELSIGGNGGGGSSSSSLGTTVGACVTNAAGVGDRGTLDDSGTVDNLPIGWGRSSRGNCGQKTSGNN